MRLKIAKILPLAFADTARQIQCAERNDPEHLSTLYLRIGSILKRIRENRKLTIQGLSVLSGVREDTLEASESGRFEMTGVLPLKRSWTADRLYPPAHQKRLYRILESPQSPLAVIIVDRVRLRYLGRNGNGANSRPPPGRTETNPETRRHSQIAVGQAGRQWDE